MNLTTKKRNLRNLLFNSIASTSMLGGMLLTLTPANAIPVDTQANLDRGTNRISVDLYRYIKREYQNYRVRPDCQGDLDSGQLIIRCDVSDYVEGGGVFPSSTRRRKDKNFHIRIRK